MRKAEAEDRIKKLRDEIRLHNWQYHVLDKPVISDSAYDSLFRELVKLEREFPELVTEDSPTRRIGGEPLTQFKKVRHSRPMLSLEDVRGEEEFEAWMARIQKLAPTGRLTFFGELMKHFNKMSFSIKLNNIHKIKRTKSTFKLSS